MQGSSSAPNGLWSALRVVGDVVGGMSILSSTVVRTIFLIKKCAFSECVYGMAHGERRPRQFCTPAPRSPMSREITQREPPNVCPKRYDHAFFPGRGHPRYDHLACTAADSRVRLTSTS